MVFENIVRSIKDNPLYFFISVFVTVSVSLFVSYYIFPEQASVVFIFFIVVSFVSTVRQMILLEEKTLEIDEKASFWKKLNDTFVRNSHIFSIYTQIFIGIMLTISFWYVLLPENMINTMFQHQNVVISRVSGYIVNKEIFGTIFMNNFRVLLLSFLLSFLFGTGALFIISWNASVVGVFLGKLGREALDFGIHKVIASIILGAGSIVLHGVPEVLAYFVAGISGGILSIGIFKKKYTREILEDSLFFFLIAVFLIIVAAFIESVY